MTIFWVLMMLLISVVSGQDNNTDIFKADRVDDDIELDLSDLALLNQIDQDNELEPMMLNNNTTDMNPIINGSVLNTSLIAGPQSNDTGLNTSLNTGMMPLNLFNGSIPLNGSTQPNPSTTLNGSVAMNGSTPFNASLSSTTPLNASLSPTTPLNASTSLNASIALNGSIPLNASIPLNSVIPTNILSTVNGTQPNTTTTNVTNPAMNLTSLVSSGKFPDVLAADQRLLGNQSLVSRNRQYVLHITLSCNIEIIRVRDGMRIWSSNTTSTMGPCSLMMQRTGLLTILDRNLHHIWKSDSNQGQDPASLRLLDTGNLIISDMMLSILWKTDPDWRRDHMNGGEIIADPTPLIASNRIYSLQITDSCQLAIRKQGVVNPIWTSTTTNTTTRCRLSLDKLGVLSLLSDQSRMIWSNNYTSGIGDEPFQLRLLQNGTLILTSSQVPVWLVNEHGIASLL